MGRRLWLGALALATWCAAGATGAAANPPAIRNPTAFYDPHQGNWLLGAWQIVDPACSTEAREVYTPAAWSRFVTDKGWKPGWTTYDVHYVVSQAYVWVNLSGYGSQSGRVFFVDANHYKADDTQGCIYARSR